jgi:hypothetical protein
MGFLRGFAGISEFLGLGKPFLATLALKSHLWALKSHCLARKSHFGALLGGFGVWGVEWV